MSDTYSSPVPLKSRHTAAFKQKGYSSHAGDDYAPPTPGQKGVKVRAVSAGTVQTVGTNIITGHTGQAVLIDHGNRKDKFGTDHMQTYSGHLAKILVKRGQKVATGQVIGIMGETGNASGIHLHLGVLCNSRFIDAHAWLGRKGIVPGKTAPVEPEKSKTYTVKAGDTLGAIAAKYKTTAAALAKKNGIRNPDIISVGQKIKL